MVDFINKSLILISVVLCITACSVNTQEKVKTEEPKEYVGWWVYGEEQHIFKDEITLEEWELIFLNENIEELAKLYLAVCEMEYFPMECMMQGNLENDTLIVADFEILYIEGCGE